MNRRYKLMVGLLGMTLLVGCGNAAVEEETTAIAEVQQSATSVEVANPTNGTIKDEYSYSGKIVAKTQVDVAAPMASKVKNVNFKLGEHVNKGDILFTMDTTEIENNIKTARSTVKLSDLNIKEAKANLEAAQGISGKVQLDNAEIDIKNAEKVIENAKKEYENNQALYDVGTISAQELQNCKDQLEKGELDLEQKRNSLVQLREQLKQEVTKAENTLNVEQNNKVSAQEQLKMKERALVDANVTSPISGTISACNAFENSMLPQSNVAFTIVDTDHLNIQVNVSEQIMASLNCDSEVQITVPVISDQAFTGKIQSLSPTAEKDGTYVVNIDIENKSEELKVGMTAMVSLAKQKSENTLILPRDVVMLQGEKYYVFVNENDKAVKKEVEVGIDSGDNIEIKKGLSQSDLVVVKGQTFLEEGDVITNVAVNGEAVK